MKRFRPNRWHLAWLQARNNVPGWAAAMLAVAILLSSILLLFQATVGAPIIAETLGTAEVIATRTDLRSRASGWTARWRVKLDSGGHPIWIRGFLHSDAPEPGTRICVRHQVRDGPLGQTHRFTLVQTGACPGRPTRL